MEHKFCFHCGLSLFSHYVTHGWGTIEAAWYNGNSGQSMILEPEITGLNPNFDMWPSTSCLTATSLNFIISKNVIIVVLFPCWYKEQRHQMPLNVVDAKVGIYKWWLLLLLILLLLLSLAALLTLLLEKCR